MWELGVGLVSLALVVICHWIYVWYNPKCKNGKLPPGSMGLPIIGETFSFFSSHDFFHIPPFISHRMARYGNLFRTSLIGQKVIVSTDPEINYKVLQQENESLVMWFTDSFLGIVGNEDDLMAIHGGPHKYLKSLVLKVLAPENVRDKLLHKVDEATRKFLHLWATEGTVHVKQGAAYLIYESYGKSLLGYKGDDVAKLIVENLEAFMDGLIAFPIYFPGTAFYKCIQGRNKAMKVIKNIYEARKNSQHYVSGDFLDRLLAEVEKVDTFIDDKISINLIFVLLFAAQEAVAQALTLLTKFILEHPKVLQELTKEHESIINQREKDNSEVSVEEYKSMAFTHMVINESVRLANIQPTIFRKVVKDMEINGYKIPKNWIFLAFTSVVHLDPKRYSDPLIFNPWRWEGQELHSGSKTFMAFGGSARLCLGAELAKVQMAIYLHYLVTKYRCSVIKGGEVIRKPTIAYPEGMQISIQEKNK